MQLGQYQVWEEIGRGGMGVVYGGYDPLIGREVALKTIHLQGIVDPRERQDSRDPLRRKAQSAATKIATICLVGRRAFPAGRASCR